MTVLQFLLPAIFALFVLLYMYNKKQRQRFTESEKLVVMGKKRRRKKSGMPNVTAGKY